MISETGAPSPTIHHPARVLVVEDHPIVRTGLVRLLESAHRYVVCAAVGSQEDARAALRQHQVDIVLLDLMLGDGDNLRFISELTQQYDGLKILVISAMNESVYAERVLRAGALGYIMKSAEMSEVLVAVGSVVEGRVYLGPKIFVKLFRGLLHRSALGATPGAEGLSDRELQVFQLIGAKSPNRDIARQLGISVKTVETHREKLKVKLGAADSTELASAAERFVGSILA